VLSQRFHTMERIPPQPHVVMARDVPLVLAAWRVDDTGRVVTDADGTLSVAALMSRIDDAMAQGSD